MCNHLHQAIHAPGKLPNSDLIEAYVHNRVRNTSVFIISNATTILNTMPIWLTELADKTGTASTFVGLIASLNLISAAT
ncbi:hypothetical protein M3P21_20210, partial [Ruegeria sp. 2012CJ41-6]